MTEDYQKGAIARGFDWLLGVGWTKRVVRLASYSKVAIIAIASGSIALNEQSTIHLPWLANHWPAITSGALLLKEIISTYQANEQVKAVPSTTAN